MKKILMMAALMVATLTANAQNDELKNEIGIYYGFGSASNIVSAIGTAFNLDSDDKTGFWGPIGAEYFYRATPMVSVGGMLSFAGCNWSSKNDAKSTYITVMPAVKFNWLHKEHFGLYSMLAAGAMYHHAKADKESDNQVVFMGHVTALGVEFGGQLRGFGEAGFGERGAICAGLRYKF
jgi:hypothetical protein